MVLGRFVIWLSPASRDLGLDLGFEICRDSLLARTARAEGPARLVFFQHGAQFFGTSVV